MIVLVEGCGTNVASIQFALMRLGKESVVTSNANIIQNALHVILPGVSSAQRAMQALKDRALIDVIRLLQQPVLGICSGMQILFEYSEEANTTGLGIFKNTVKKINAVNNPLPHMGWNRLFINGQKQSQLTKGVPKDSDVYFIHSYGADISDDTLAHTEYGSQFSAIVMKDNFYGVQFHPERSGEIGERLLMNFLNLR